MSDKKLTSSLFTESIQLRNSTFAISDPIIEELKLLINSEKISKNFHINGCYSGSSFEITTKNGKLNSSKEIFPGEIGIFPMLEETGGIDIDISVIHGTSFDIDGEYTFDLSNSDGGGITIIVKIPKNQFTNEMLGIVSKKLYGHVAHELQHACQRLIHRKKLKVAASTSVEKHIHDLDEIDARIEEILVMLNSYDDLSLEAFLSALDSYADEYLTRNSVSDKTLYNSLKDKMNHSHLLAFRKKYCRGKNGENNL